MLQMAVRTAASGEGVSARAEEAMESEMPFCSQTDKRSTGLHARVLAYSTHTFASRARATRCRAAEFAAGRADAITNAFQAGIDECIYRRAGMF